MSPTHHNSEEELTIDSIHGLKSFLVYADDAYQAFMAEAAQSNSPTKESLISHVEALYAEINALVARYVKILDWGGEMSVDQGELLQHFYNQIVEAYDSLQAPQTESQRVALINQVETATFLLERGVRLLEAFSEIQTTPLKSSAITSGKNTYAALQENCTNAKLIFDAIEASVETTTLADATIIATEQAQGLAEIEATFDTLEESLTTLFESGALENVPRIKESPEDKKNSLFQTSQATTLFGPFIKIVVAHPRYAAVVKEVFSSPAMFEAALRREVYRVEAPSKLDALLGIKHGSAFLFMKDMTLAELDTFDGTQNRPAIRAVLSEKNIPYEIYMNWIQAVPYMESLVESFDEMTFGELFVRSEVELLLENAQ